MKDDNVLWDYGVDQDGVISVVNAKVYAKEVTREEADKRVQQVKSQKRTSLNWSQNRMEKNLQVEKGDNSSVLNIIQNIVHDTDSEV